MWEILFHGAKHYMHLLLAASPSTLFEKTAFGMSVVLMGKCENLSAGFQRLNYPLGNPNQAAAMVITNAAKLARAQLARRVPPAGGLRRGHAQLDPSPVVHFDAIYARADDDVDRLRLSSPFGHRLLPTPANRHYKMHFRP